jgi:WD40 repeat protein
VTCSLDKTIKIWDVSAPTYAGGSRQPIAVICTTYPVWRARDLPFGQGILSLPQRGATELEMWTNGIFVEKFVGHSDVVKEFVWRRGGLGAHFHGFPVRHSHPALVGDSEFQLITWSKDRTLRFWPIDSEVMAVNCCLHMLLAPTLNYYPESRLYARSERRHCYLRWRWCRPLLPEPTGGN